MSTARRQTTTWTTSFFLILVILIGLGQTFAPDSTSFIEPVYVVIAVVPFVFYLVATGQIAGLKGGGFAISLREQARKLVSPRMINEPLQVVPEDFLEKGSLPVESQIEEGNSPTTLAFTLERRGYYDQWAIEEYVRELSVNPEFRYALFIDSNGRFEGYMPIESWEMLIESGIDVVEELETGDILNRSVMHREWITDDITNMDALDEMEEQNIDKLAVVDDEHSFVGVVTQDEIVRKILVGAIRET
jgi:CBS domain-containing protein